MTREKTLRAVWLALAAVLLSASLCAAQVSTSTITGTVVDKSGAAVPGAKVVVKNEATGVEYTTTTTSTGSYTVSSLIPGSYTITVTQPGFRTFTSAHNGLTVGSPLVVDATLEVGEVTQVVQVEATYERLDTTSAMLSGVVGRKEIVELPLNGRNPLNLIIFEPGLVQRSTGAAGSGTHVFGSRDRAHNVTIDGIDANESSVPNPQSNVYRLTPDNIQEYRVVTHNATPEFGRNSGANVTIATRSGTNEIHGDVFYFHRNTVLNSNEFFNNAFGQDRPILLLHQFGGDVGGPIIKNRTFFFFSYQGNRIKQTQPISQSFGIPTLYTATAKQGIFRYVTGNITFTPPGASAPITVSQNDRRLVDDQGNLVPGVPVCTATVTNNCVASFNMFAADPAGIGADPLMLGLINSIPNPNSFSIGDGLNTAGYVWNTPSRFKGPFFQLRGDHRFNDNHSIFARMLWSDYDTSEGDLLNARPAVFPGFRPLGEVFRSSQNLAISYRAVLSPRIVNDFTMGYSRFQFFFSLAESNLAGGDPVPYGQECFGTDSLDNIDAPYCNTPHTARAVSTVQFIDNLSYTRGAHNFKTGFNFRFYRHNDSRGVPGGFNMAPTIIMRSGDRAIGVSDPAGLNSADSGRFQQAMSEFMGVVSQVNQAYQANLSGDTFTTDLFTLGTRIKHFDVYVQDEWKLRRNLTLTYGLRWEWKRPGRDCCGRTFAPDRDVLGSQGQVTYSPADSWWAEDNATALAPRVALAWDPWSDGKTVIRAGWGIAFDTISSFQVTSIGGKVPGSTLLCFTRLGATPGGGCPAIPSTPNGRVSQLMAAVSPFTLPVPAVKPSQSFTPAPAAAGTAPGVGAFDPNLRVPTVHEWDLTIQRELPAGFVVQVGYIGKRGIRLYRAYDINQISTNQAGFLDSFLIAQQNLAKGCRPDGTGCPTGVTGQTPTLLVNLAGASFLNGSTSRTNISLNGLGDLSARIDALTGTTGSGFAQRIVQNGFAASYFRPNPQFSDIFYFDSGGSSTYHGMIVQLHRRFQQGLTLNFAYTFSKSIDDMSVDPVAATSGGGLSTTNSRTPTDVRNFALDRSVSDFDNRHVIAANVLYELPFGKGRRWASTAPGWLDHIIGGWTGTSIFTYQSGEPFTLNSGIRTVNNTKQSRVEVRGPMVFPTLFELASVDGPVVYNVGQRVGVCKAVLDPDGNATGTEFCIPAPGQFGTTGRNAVYGPGYWNVDIGILKNFSVTERVRFQFRAEFFNAFNHANFDNPRNASTGSPTLTSSVFGQTCCVASAVPSTTTVIANGEPNRVIQFGFKISF